MRLGNSLHINRIPNYLGGASSSLLLDLIPNAKVAYDLILLKSDYTGDCIKVRRLSDDATQDIGFAVGILDTASLETFCSGTDGFIHTWYDQSGNGNNLVALSDAEQPKIVSSGTTLTLNSKPAMLFATEKMQAVFTSSVSIVSAFFVFTAANDDIVTDNDAVSNKNSIYISGGATTIRLYNGSGVTHTLSSGTFASQSLGDYISDGASSQISINGDTTTGSISATAMTGLTIGNSAVNFRSLTGYMQNIILYGENKLSEMASIRTIINNYYSIY